MLEQPVDGKKKYGQNSKVMGEKQLFRGSFMLNCLYRERHSTKCDNFLLLFPVIKVVDGLVEEDQVELFAPDLGDLGDEGVGPDVHVAHDGPGAALQGKMVFLIFFKERGGMTCSGNLMWLTEKKYAHFQVIDSIHGLSEER